VFGHVRTRRHILRGLARFVAVALLAGAIGAGLGVGIAELTDDGDPGPASEPGSISVAARPSGRIDLHVLSSVFSPAVSASGRARDRARLSVRLRATNDTDRAITLRNAVLVVEGQEVRPDPDAGRVSRLAARLLRPIGAGRRATGELRFEVAGDTTSALRRERRARLRVAGQIESLSLTFAQPARSAPPSPAR